MTVLITLTTAGTDSGPFNLYSNLDGYTSAFESGVSQAALLAGYASSLVPDYTTIVRILSTGTCTNYIDITLDSLPCPTHIYVNDFIYQTDTIGVFLTLTDACDGVACLIAETCGASGSQIGYSDSPSLNIGDFVYYPEGSCTPLTLSGYYIIYILGVPTVVEMAAGEVIDFPICPT
jgi:hypothetical protein